MSRLTFEPARPIDTDAMAWVPTGRTGRLNPDAAAWRNAAAGPGPDQRRHSP